MHRIYDNIEMTDQIQRARLELLKVNKTGEKWVELVYIAQAWGCVQKLDGYKRAW